MNTVTRYVPDTPGRVLAAVPFAAVFAVGVGVLGPLEVPLGYLELLAGGVVGMVVLARAERVRDVVGLGCYLVAIVTALVPVRLFVAPVLGGGEMGLLTAGAGLATVGVGALIVAGVLAGVGRLVHS